MSKLKMKRNNDSNLNIKVAATRSKCEQHAVTSQSKVKLEEFGGKVDLTGNEDEVNSDEGLLDFSFGNHNEMEQFEVVINAAGDTVVVHAPRVFNFPAPQEGFAEHHIFFKCESPWKRTSDKTVIPMRGMYGHYFYEKRFITTEHEMINGKINAWRLECMKAFAKLRQTGRVLQATIDDQGSYVRDRVGIVQKNHLKTFL